VIFVSFCPSNLFGLEGGARREGGGEREREKKFFGNPSLLLPSISSSHLLPAVIIFHA
jgi:hypothetical protein